MAMPVANVDTVDAVGIDQESGKVLLAMYEERSWENCSALLSDLERKVNRYLEYIFSGQLDETAEYNGRDREIELHCRFIPVTSAHAALKALHGHLVSRGIGFAVYVGLDRSFPLSLH
jgi:hypothetical protein